MNKKQRRNRQRKLEKELATLNAEFDYIQEIWKVRGALNLFYHIRESYLGLAIKEVERQLECNQINRVIMNRATYNLLNRISNDK